MSGRPTKYQPELAEELIKFFDMQAFEMVPSEDKHGNPKTELIPSRFPTLARFAAKIGVCRDTLHEWATAETEDGSKKHPEFSDAYKRAKEFQEAVLVEGAMAGVFNPAFSIFTAKNVLGWRDKTETSLTTSGLSINIDLNDKNGETA